MLEKYLSEQELSVVNKPFEELKLNHDLVPRIQFLQESIKGIAESDEVKANLEDSSKFLLTYANKWFVETISEGISDMESDEVKAIKTQEEAEAYVKNQPYKIENFRVDVLNMKHGLGALKLFNEKTVSGKIGQLLTQKGAYIDEEGVPHLISLDTITEEERIYLDKEGSVKEEHRFQQVSYEEGLKAVIGDFYRRLEESIKEYDKIAEQESSLKECINIAIVEENEENCYYYDKYDHNGKNQAEDAILVLLEDLDKKEVNIKLNTLFNAEVTKVTLATGVENINELFRENEELNLLINYFFKREELNKPVYLIGTSHEKGTVINVYYTEKNGNVYFFLTTHSNEGCSVMPMNNISTNYINTQRAVNFYNHKNKMSAF